MAAGGDVNRKVVLARRPEGLPGPESFRIEEEAVGALPPGKVRVDVEHLSVDAFIRTILEEGSYHASVPIGGLVTAFGVGRVRESDVDGFAPGDAVCGGLGAQTVATLPPGRLMPVDGDRAPLSAYLGVLGLTSGMTAYMGVRHVGHVAAGESFVVSGAAGAVGSVAGQIAKIDGAKVVGIAGGPEKGSYLVDDLGFDAAIDYKREDVGRRLDEILPDGVDVFFDNVGGELLDTVLDRIRERARVVICGAISQYNDGVTGGVRGPSLYLRLAERHARMEGFAVDHFRDRYAEAATALADWLARDEIRLREHVVPGIDRFGEALQMLLTGGNTGKLLVDVRAS